MQRLLFPCWEPGHELPATTLLPFLAAVGRCCSRDKTKPGTLLSHSRCCWTKKGLGGGVPGPLHGLCGRPSHLTKPCWGHGSKGHSLPVLASPCSALVSLGNLPPPASGPRGQAPADARCPFPFPRPGLGFPIYLDTPAFSAPLPPQPWYPIQLEVNCSRGVAQLGTFLAMDQLLQQAGAECTVDIFNVALQQSQACGLMTPTLVRGHQGSIVGRGEGAGKVLRATTRRHSLGSH